MNKKLVLLISLIICLNLISFVSAWDSYSDWYNNYWNVPSSSSSSNYYNSYSPGSEARDYSLVTTEYKQTTTTENQDPWNYERKSTTIVVTDETETENIVPIYYNNYNGYYPGYNNYYTNQNYNSNQNYYNNPSYNSNTQSFKDWCRQIGTPYTSWQYKNTYDGVQRYDACEGYYNYRN